MDQSRIAVRYARAAFELAQEQNKLDVLVEDMRHLNKLFSDNSDLLQFFDNPVIKKSEKLKTVNKLFTDNLNDFSVNFIRLIVQHHREKQIQAICRRIDSLYKTHKGIQSLEIRSADKLDDKSRKKLSESVKSALGAKEIELKETVDNELIGGFVLRTDDLQYDASIKTQLDKLKRHFKETLL
ncbi:MAG TPA: ATP synthase F1 subunit delta [Bacteroidales bacterium]|nr:ATP synthase F1 subunit delta [Bacteroidales bacterium]